MSADFCLTKFPQFTLYKDDREEQFRQVISNMSKEDEQHLRDNYHYEESKDEIVEDLLECIGTASAISCNETTEGFEYDKSGTKISVVYTGGMSRGDFPTEIFPVIDKAQELDQVYELANKFSGEDTPQQQLVN